MAAKALPSPDELRKLLDYDPETGVLTWKFRPVAMFSAGKQSASHNAATWNARYAGSPALTARNAAGYQVGFISGLQHRAHRVCWAIYRGAWPCGCIDHINGDVFDNRIKNLRDVTHVENCRNQKLRATNTSGLMGVSWDNGRSKWHSTIEVDGRTKHLGYFTDIAAAASARKAAEVESDFHWNHGRNA